MERLNDDPMSLNPASPLGSKKLSTRDRVELMHAEYRKFRPDEAPLRVRQVGVWDVEDPRVRWWKELLTGDHTVDELNLVLRYYQFRISQRPERETWMRLRNVANRELFEENLGWARQWARQQGQKPTAGERALRQFRRTDEGKPLPEPKTPRQLLPALARSWGEQARAAIERPRE